MNRRRQPIAGFTLIELMLSMLFISVLLVAMVSSVIQISSIYHRGITIRQVNQASRVIVDDMTRSIAASSSFDPADSAIAQGRLCTGTYTYIWNTADRIDDPLIRNNYSSGSTVLRLVRVADPGRQYCITPTLAINPIGASELLGAESDRPLAIHELTVSSDSSTVNSATGQRLYTIDFVLGTVNMAALEYDSLVGTRCRPPADNANDTKYCAINSFSFTARAGIR